MPPINNQPTAAAMAINNDGIAVGYAGENDGEGDSWEIIQPNNGIDYDAFIWDTKNGNTTGIDLQSLLSPADNALYDLQAATGINNNGQVVGLYKLRSDITADGFDNAPLHAFELSIQDVTPPLVTNVLINGSLEPPARLRTLPSRRSPSLAPSTIRPPAARQLPRPGSPSMAERYRLSDECCRHAHQQR